MSPKKKRQGKHRKRRLNNLDCWSTWPDVEAPIGAYQVDEVAQDLFNCIEARPIYDQTKITKDKVEFIKLVREKVGSAGAYSLFEAKQKIERAPRKARELKRLFEDLRHIRLRIGRNRNLTNVDVMVWTDRDYGSKRLLPHQEAKNLIENLLNSLQQSSKLIDDFLETYQLRKKKGGNHDWLTYVFVREIFELWCDLLWTEVLPSESQLFVGLLSAAWRDTRLPIDEEDGRDLNEWLADRVRKQIPKGVGIARTTRNEFEEWEASLILDV